MMEFDNYEHRGQGGFPVDQPMEALRKDHAFVQQLFERYLNTQDRDVRLQAGPRILALLELHTALEESVFYPGVHVADPTLVDHCEEEHQQAKQLIEQLHGMPADSASAEPLFRQLADAIRLHIDHEENQLFPELERANLDMTALGLEMAAFEANKVSAQARASEQPRMRP
jgi:hypothetical protein